MTTISLPVVQPAVGLAGAPVSVAAPKETTVGNYFVANYPPFGFWKPEHVGALRDVMGRAPESRTELDLGVYAHIPFCRKRCHFCYFRVYTDKNSREIGAYLDAMVTELERAARSAVFAGRRPTFVYFGGGTPSYLSVDQLRRLTDRMKGVMGWDAAREVAFEAEPGTLNEGKLRALKDMGVTRLSLGIEHFDDRVLEINGRAHRSAEIERAYGWARGAGFAQINVDLIAGMVEETDAGWDATVEKTLGLSPDSVTIYQMEVPYNTTIYRRMQAEGALVAPVADWATKRAWVDRAFARFTEAGYTVVTATTVVKDPTTRFLYRQGLFDGTDVLSVGVSSFGHVQGVNYQNQHDIGPYVEAVSAGVLPTYRAYPLSASERYIRELALQLKGGWVSVGAFARRFGEDPRERFAGAISGLVERGLMRVDDERIALTRAGLLQADRLLYEFFLPEHRTGRYA
jgi:oxygen-independent coproporphyrinogen-3 oxidase